MKSKPGNISLTVNVEALAKLVRLCPCLNGKVFDGWGYNRDCPRCGEIRRMINATGYRQVRRTDKGDLVSRGILGQVEVSSGDTL